MHGVFETALHSGCLTNTEAICAVKGICLLAVMMFKVWVLYYRKLSFTLPLFPPQRQSVAHSILKYYVLRAMIE